MGLIDSSANLNENGGFSRKSLPQDGTSASDQGHLHPTVSDFSLIGSNFIGYCSEGSFDTRILRDFLFFCWVSRVRKSGAIRCLGRRDLGSSVPVRYVPKVPSKGNRANDHEKPETPPAKSPEMSEAQSMSNADAMRSRVYRAGNGEVIVNGFVCAEIRSPVDKRLPIIDVVDAAPGRNGSNYIWM